MDNVYLIMEPVDLGDKVISVHLTRRGAEDALAHMAANLVPGTRYHMSTATGGYVDPSDCRIDEMPLNP